MEYRVLGPFEVRDGDRSLPLAGAKQRALLALLLLHANQMLSRDRLIDELWGEEPPATAVQSLHVYVSRLRKVLPAGTLLTRPPGYLLELEPDELDLRRFERLLADGREELPAATPGAPRAALHDALALWRGPALAEFAFEPFAQVEIGRLDELRLAAVEERVDADLALGRHTELVGELEALIAENPHRERMRGQLMLALYRSGRQAEALEAYHDAHAALDELGIEPSERLRELERAILTHDAMLVAPPPLFGDEIMLPAPLRVSSPFPFVGRDGSSAFCSSLIRSRKTVKAGRWPSSAARQAAARHGSCVSSPARRPSAGRSCCTEARTPWSTRLTSPSWRHSSSWCGWPTRRLSHAVSEQDAPSWRESSPTSGPAPLPAAGDPESERRRLHSAVVELLTRVSRATPAAARSSTTFTGPTRRRCVCSSIWPALLRRPVPGCFCSRRIAIGARTYDRSSPKRLPSSHEWTA